LRGLRWTDIDLARNELHVRQRADRFHTIGALKSATSQRSIPLLPMVTNELREWRLAAPRNESGLVFPGNQGRPITLATIIEMTWHPAQIAAGVVAKGGSAKYSGLHALRHFYASWCINRRVDGGLELPLKVVQARMGHSSIQITADRYGHLFPRGDDSAELAAAEKAFKFEPWCAHQISQGKSTVLRSGDKRRQGRPSPSSRSGRTLAGQNRWERSGSIGRGAARDHHCPAACERRAHRRRSRSTSSRYRKADSFSSDLTRPRFGALGSILDSPLPLGCGSRAAISDLSEMSVRLAAGPDFLTAFGAV
jgi:hypothetical protein